MGTAASLRRGVQTEYDGGLVRIAHSGTCHVSVVGSTLTNITVRAQCSVPSENPHTAEQLHAPRSAASTQSTLPAYRLGARYSLSIGVLPGTCGGHRRELAAACGMQAIKGRGGLVANFDSGTIVHVSVVGSTLTGISVRAHC